MATSKLTPAQLAKIVAAKMPGAQIVEENTVATDSGRYLQADAISPDLASLRKKWFPNHEADQPGPEVNGSHQPDDNDDTVYDVAVRPGADVDAGRYGPGAKRVMISGVTKRVIGAQG